jgi:hypothetical protein
MKRQNRQNNRRGKRKPRGNNNRASQKKTAKKMKRSIRPPAAIGTVLRTKGVMRRLRLKHREFVKDVTFDGTANELEIHSVNPALAFFPWLSGVAVQFESYIFHNLEFEWIPAVGTDTTGSVAIIPDYDSADDNTSLGKQRLLSFQDAVRGPIWQPFRCVCSKGNLRKMKTYYTRKAPLVGSLDIKTYDVCQVILSKTTPTAHTAAGELWVNYDVTLLTPQLNEEPVLTVDLKAQSGSTNSFTTGYDYLTNQLRSVITNSPDDPTSESAGSYISQKLAGLYNVAVGHEFSSSVDDIVTFSGLSAYVSSANGGGTSVESYFVTDSVHTDYSQEEWHEIGTWYCPEEDISGLDLGEEPWYTLLLDNYTDAGGQFNALVLRITKVDESEHLPVLKQMRRCGINNLNSQVANYRQIYDRLKGREFVKPDELILKKREKSRVKCNSVTKGEKGEMEIDPKSLRIQQLQEMLREVQTRDV